MIPNWFRKYFVQKVRVAYRLEADHDGGEIPNYHAWFMPGRILYLNKHGSGTGTFSWTVLECDNPTCSGQALVSLDQLKSVPLGTVLADPPGTIDRWEEHTGRTWRGSRELS